MQYVALIYGDQAAWDAKNPEDRKDTYEAYEAFAQEVSARGAMRGGSELQSPTTATTVRVRGDETLVTDGPFAETKEYLGGLFLVECDDLDAAIEIAAKIPAARTGGAIEVRPVIPH